MSRERGVWEEHLEGEPYALGYAQARLGSRLLLEQEDYMFSEMNHYVPSKVALFLIRVGVRLKFRHVADYLPAERQEEIAGLAAGSIDRHSDFLPTYHRLVFYHALHDATSTSRGRRSSTAKSRCCSSSPRGASRSRRWRGPACRAWSRA